MPISKNNFSRNENYEVGSVDKTYFTVDFINAMNGETSDFSASNSTAGLEMTRATIEGQGVPVLAEGPLTDSNTQKTYATRTDCLDSISSILILESNTYLVDKNVSFIQVLLLREITTSPIPLFLGVST